MNDWRGLGFGVLCIGVLAAGAAVAESPVPKTGAEPESELENEIIVTALRRNSLIQSTPVSVSAVSGDALRKAETRDLSALKSVPGLTFVDAGSANVRVVIRGVQTVGEPTAGLYYDETTVTGVVGASNDAGGTMPGLKLFDVERVEVLRGPQGTLYGAGAMGGALKVVFNKPSQGFSAAADLTASQVDRGDMGSLVQGMVNLPVIKDRLAVRVVLFDETRPGYIENTVLKRSGLDKESTTGGRLLARFTPHPSVTIDAGMHYQETQGDRPQWRWEAGPYKATSQMRLPTRQVFSLYNLTGKWDLGAVVATGAVSVVSRKHWAANGDPSYYFQGLIDHAATCARLRGNGSACTPTQQSDFNAYIQTYVHGVVFAAQKSRTTTAEMRLSSQDEGRLTWTIGGFLSKREAHNDNQQLKTDPLTGDILRPVIVDTMRVIDDELKQTALFGEFTFAVTPRLSLTAGTRYFAYDRKVAGATVVPLDLINARQSAYTTVESDEKRWVSKINAAYEVSPDVLAYAQASQGFRPGGVNQVLGLPAALGPYGADSLWNYEAGLKTRSLGGRLVFNVAAYSIDWANMQVQGQTPAGPFSFISNAGAARIDGLEIESAFRPLPHLMLRANFAYTDARLSEDQLNADIIANGRKGDRIPYVPKTTGSMEAVYNWSAGRGLDGYARLAATHVGESWSEFRPNSVYYRHLPAYTSVSGRVGIESSAQGWAASLYIDNAFDEVGLTSLTASGVTAGQTMASSIAPRTIGVNLRKSF